MLLSVNGTAQSYGVIPEGWRGRRWLPKPRTRESADAFDDLDEFVEVEALSAGEGDEFLGLGDDRLYSAVTVMLRPRRNSSSPSMVAAHADRRGVRGFVRL
jgi:hypothetical protein